MLGGRGCTVAMVADLEDLTLHAERRGVKARVFSVFQTIVLHPAVKKTSRSEVTWDEMVHTL